MRLPPHNLESERGVLGSLLLGRDGIDVDAGDVHEVLTKLHPDDFYRDDHAQVYRAILAVHASNRPIDLITVAEELARAGRFEDVDGNRLLAELVESVPHAAHLAFYADLVRQKALAREVIGAAERVIGEAFAERHTGEELVGLLQDVAFRVGDRGESRRSVAIGAAARAALERMDRREAGVRTGLGTGFWELDQMAGGLEPGQLIVLGARPAQGKTAVALNMAQHVAAIERAGVLFIRLEMSSEELGDRALCGSARVPGGKFADPDAAERERLRSATERFWGTPIYINDSPAQSVGQVSALARRHQRRDGIGLLVIASLQLIDADEMPRGSTRQEAVAAMTRAPKRLGVLLRVPVLLLCQLNREVERREDKRPQIADLRESGAIEQDADKVLLLHRPAAYDPADRPGEADIIVAKNRGGPTGTVRLAFDGPTFTFSDYGSTPGEERVAF